MTMCLATPLQPVPMAKKETDMILVFSAWMTAYYVIGFLVVTATQKWQIAIPVALLALAALIATWPAVDYAHTSGFLIGVFALILFVSGLGSGEVVRTTKDQMRWMDEQTERLAAS